MLMHRTYERTLESNGITNMNIKPMRVIGCEFSCKPQYRRGIPGSATKKTGSALPYRAVL